MRPKGSATPLANAPGWLRPKRSSALVVRKRRLAFVSPCRHPGNVDDELISRDELAATLFAINDIRDEVLKIRRLLEEEGDGEAPENDA